jgi:hypothetical protein
VMETQTIWCSSPEEMEAKRAEKPTTCTDECPLPGLKRT